ncbi:MAG TPA: hypothetical protein VM848_13785 [Acidimicrobiia bacterium]|nr:hypothetical protein [Acidimicrobiia bacterium]
MVKKPVGTWVYRSSKCPNCGEQRLVPIVYGYPSESLLERWREGVVELGGCMVSDFNPPLHCKSCQHDVWRDRRTRPSKWLE